MPRGLRRQQRRAAGDKGTIGVAMPTKSSERWIADGNNIKKQLEAAGYKVDLQYAEDDIPTQVSQVENMVTKGEKSSSSPPSTVPRSATCSSRPRTPTSRSSPTTG